jgi:proteasome lid subunit RPN8/RPN11
MTARLTVRTDDRQSLPRLHRSRARDGWRVFRSPRDEYEIAFPEYQVSRAESIAKHERKEWHALVVGERHEDEDGVHAVARDFVPNDWAERGTAHVHVSAMAECRIRELAARLHPKLVPLGIIHTHPGYSTRPSGTDRAEFWSDPHAISIIVDPTDCPSMAVYRGPEGERLVEHATPLVAEAPELRNELPLTTPAAPMPVVSQLGAQVRSKARWLSLVASAAALLLILGIRSDMARTHVELRRLAADIMTLESRLDAKPRRTHSPPPTTAPATVPDGPGAICSEDSTSW